MSESSPATVLTDIDARGVATVTLNRAEKHNAFDDAVIAELDATFASLAQEPALRVVVLASTGKSFSAGADLAWMQRMAEYDHRQNLEDARALAEMLRKLNHLPQPTIARVQGAAYGGAVGLVSCCDMAIGSEQARFCLSEVKLGLIPATISPYVIAAMGQRAARRYFISAELFNASTALQLGLLSEVVPAEELDARIDAACQQLLQNGPLAVAAAKRLALDMANREIGTELIEDSCRRIADIRVSEEGQQGLQAFLNKTVPAWSKPHV
ncbi:MAG: enoyl-CoA hydratase/isomerase family protein [Gammaproteobacteria bacterium]|nr:enoyl-CoA hydratase/isomerase family protein [Gammaproteobacteria bacterium]